MNEHVNVDPNLSPNVPIEDQEARSVPPPSKIPPAESPVNNLRPPVKEALIQVEGTVAEASNEPKDGSALEAAVEASNVAQVLREKASDVKRRADEVFVNGSQANQGPSCPIDPWNGKNVGSELREQIQDLEERLAGFKASADDGEFDPVKDAAALDKLADLLEEKAEELEELKRELAAKQLNDLDGFDR